MSNHRVEIVKIEEILKHCNGDALEIIPIFGYTAISRKGQFKVGDLAVYVEPDYCVPVMHESFSFLKTDKPKMHERVRAKRLRGTWSQGLLIPLPKELEGRAVGDNVMNDLGIIRYEPPALRGPKSGGGHLGGGEEESGPDVPFNISKYDLENYKKYHKTFSDNDDVIYSVKLHGSSAKFCYSGGRMYCGSRDRWTKKPKFGAFAVVSDPKRPDDTAETVAMQHRCILEWDEGELTTEEIDAQVAEKVAELEAENRIVNVLPKREKRHNAWWAALEQNPWIEEWCKKNENAILYGEIVGETVQGNKFHYGHKGMSIGFYAFDILRDGKWEDNVWMVAADSKFMTTVPVVYVGKHNRELIEKLAEEKETFNQADHIREGIVIKSAKEAWDEKLGRKALKYVSNTYYERS